MNLEARVGDGPVPVADRPVEERGRSYRLRRAASSEDVRRAQRLRFEVFNLELREGLAESHQTGLDADAFDEVCDHLMVEEMGSGTVVGTYRVQTGKNAKDCRGYYSEQEFDFGPFEGFRGEIVELGRACVDAAHRTLSVLSLLWRGIADYAYEHGARYLVGCSSLTSQDPREGAAMYRQLASRHLAPPEWRTVPLPAVACGLEEAATSGLKVPKLLAAYLTIGARICGPPAIDREFKTIDFLTFLDLRALPPQVAQKFLGGERTERGRRE
ncbi:MAG: GNAT family N-acetyltransferase [Verrucomicrobiae bacterium]|nr:GNAT family N-acetyltransferase [Verrucomicrobiae bacterium]